MQDSMFVQGDSGGLARMPSSTLESIMPRATLSQRNLTVSSILRKHEQEKKRNYNKRIIQVEHGTLTPLVFTTSGAMGHECQKFHKELAVKISVKNGDRYDDVMRYIRVKISFLILKAQLLCLRGSRTIKRTVEGGDDFGLCLHELRV